MESESGSKDTGTNSFSGSHRKSTIAGFQYMRKVSTSFMRKPKKSAADFLKTQENRKSISVDDVKSFEEAESASEVPKFSLKVRSLPRDGQIRIGAMYPESISPAMSDVMPLGASASTEQISYFKGRSHSITYDHFNYINSEMLNKEETRAKEIKEQKELESQELKHMKEGLDQCKKNFEGLKENFDSFKKEVRDGIYNLTALIREDDIRYAKLCYQLDNVTELHKTQLQYLHTIVDNMEEDNNKRQDDVVLDVLCEKLSMLESRISKLQ